jgi:hypothetical protein
VRILPEITWPSCCSPLMFYGFIGDESLKRAWCFMCLTTVCLEFFYDQSRRWSQDPSDLRTARGVKHNSFGLIVKRAEKVFRRRSSDAIEQLTAASNCLVNGTRS